MEETDSDLSLRDNFDEFELDMTDVQEVTTESSESEQLWVAGLRQIAQQQIDSEQAVQDRPQETKH